MKYLAFGFSEMGLKMNCQAEYTLPCKHVYVCVLGPLSNTILSPYTLFMKRSIVDKGMKKVHLCFRCDDTSWLEPA